MSKRPTDHLEPSAKKRGNSRQLTKDDASDEEESEPQGEFRQASADVMKARRIVHPKRSAKLTASSVPASNPFSGVSSTGGASNPFAGVNLLANTSQNNAFSQASKPAGLAPPHASAAADSKPAAQSTEAQAVQPESTAASAHKAAQQPTIRPQEIATQQAVTHGQEAETSGKPADQLAGAAASDFSSFLSANKEESPFAVKAGGETSAFGNGNSAGSGFGSSGFGATSGGFGGLSGSGFGATGGGFGALGKAGAAFGDAGKAKDESKTNGSTFSFRPDSTTPAASSEAQGDAASPSSTSPARQPLAAEQASQTGEEGETVLYEAEGTLFQFDDQDSKTWRERGRGELRVNRAPSGQARLVMRQRGNFRLLLNANLWPKMPVSMMDGGKGVTFPCINHARMEESEDGAASAPVPKLASFAFRKKVVSKLEELIKVIEQETNLTAAV